jgi:hypothetical protein
MNYATILKIAIATAMTCVALISCSTPKASWGKGDGMNRNCHNHFAKHSQPFNFN